MGLAGDAPIPKYPVRNPDVHAVALNKEAVPESVPVSAKLEGDGKLLGTRTSITKSPVLGPELLVKPKFKGELLLVGEFVPLSTHCPAPEQ